MPRIVSGWERDGLASTYRCRVLAYLSDDWIRALDRAVQESTRLQAATADTSIVVQTVVTGTASGSTTYAVTLDRGTNRVRPGAADHVDVSFTCDLSTAADIATGAESAQAAFMAGRLRIGGDTRTLMDNQAVLADLDDVFAAVRADTDFGGVRA